MKIAATQISATQFRKNLFQVLQQVNQTAKPLKITLKNKAFILVPEEKSSKLSKLKPHPVIHGKPEDLLNLDWSEAWSEKHI